MDQQKIKPHNLIPPLSLSLSLYLVCRAHTLSDKLSKPTIFAHPISSQHSASSSENDDILLSLRFSSTRSLEITTNNVNNKPPYS
jgi:hypothetical protein